MFNKYTPHAKTPFVGLMPLNCVVVLEEWMWCLQPTYGASHVACGMPKKERAFWQISGLSFRIVEELISSWIRITEFAYGIWGWRKRTGRGIRRTCPFSSDNLLTILCFQDGCTPVQTLPWEMVTGANYAYTEQKCPQDMKLQKNLCQHEHLPIMF